MEMRISTEEDFSKVLKETETMKRTGDFRPGKKTTLASPFDQRNAVQLPDAWTR